MNDPDPALRQQFLIGMSHAACTVNVVTTDGVAGRHGVTVSAMVSVSADTPQPTLLVCIHNQSPVADAVLKNGVFCVSVLRDDQAHISEHFAGRKAVHGPAKFDCTRWTTQVTGAPRVLEALVAFDCRVTASERVGSHFVVFGSVQDIHVAGGGAPLIYANRAYGVPRRFHPRQSPRDGSAPTTLAIGCYRVFAPYIVPALVARLTKLHPEIALRLVEADQEHLVASLRRNDMEVALLFDVGLGGGVRAELMAELKPYVLLPEGHPLSEAAAISLGDLREEPLILLDDEPSLNYYLSLFRGQGLEPQIGLRTKSPEMVRGFVGHGLGYSLLATKPANAMTYDGRALVARPLADAVENSRLVLATSANRALSPLAAEFADHCRAFFGVVPPS
ncbi:MAG TPA: LysR substrate-binding domain-containing protein [Steroidobacteraceae bacterium]|jgi:flavin reductase (DIM6/NTAB) family NADH-FMN oxidoreductase RutF|nr:LysR substrate-binding domain-containing protein [Steroidobacteraceae bacterium]